MADEKPTTSETKPAEGQVPTQAKDAGQAQPSNAAAKEAIKVDSDNKKVSAADQADKPDPVEALKGTQSYTLTKGEHSAIVQGSRKNLQVGDEVLLTEEQAKSFGDKFELTSAYQAKKSASTGESGGE